VLAYHSLNPLPRPQVVLVIAGVVAGALLTPLMERRHADRGVHSLTCPIYAPPVGLVPAVAR
jgi:hypothetical protein